LGKFLTALKHSRDNAFIAYFWKKFVIFAPEQGSIKAFIEFSLATVLYLNATSTTFNEKLRDMDNLLTSEERITVKPYLFELFDKKMDEALEKGMEKGMEKTIWIFMQKNPDWEDQQIADCFEVPLSLVQKIRSE